MKTRWHVHFAVVMTPLLIPLVAGGYWLWLNQMLVFWLGSSALLGSGWWMVNKWLRRKPADLALLDISSALEDSNLSRQAYHEIEKISAFRRNADPELASSQFYIETLIDVMQVVAGQYFPQRKDAMLEIKLPYLLKVIEMLAQDLRVNLSENVPGSHLFSLNDILRGRRFASRGRDLYRLFRIVTAGLDPVSAMVRELNLWTTGNAFSQSSAELKGWLIDAYIKKIGYYAIQLYSGNLVLDDQLVLSKPTRWSQKQLDVIERRERGVSEEPFRVLVLGQTNAGKSSLINALFGTVKAETDVIPLKGVSSYLLKREDLETSVIMDCEGYGGDDCRQLVASMADDIVRSDMILLTISATNAGREVDKQMLDAVRQEFTKQGKTNLPAIVVALTHIDQLRPLREWHPPYDVRQPNSAKAHEIRFAMETVAGDLGLELEQIAPVNLKPGFLYNIEEGLMPAIYQNLEQAKQARYLRCLRERRREDHWRLLWKQSKRTGQFIAKKSFRVFDSVPKLKSAFLVD